MFEGNSADEIEAAFHEAVDYYEELCKEVGKPPEKSYSGTLNVRLAPDLHRKVALESAAKGISINEYINNAILAMVNGEFKISAPITVNIQPAVSSDRQFDSPSLELIEGGLFYENTNYSIQ